MAKKIDADTTAANLATLEFYSSDHISRLVMDFAHGRRFTAGLHFKM